jgi:hypothetical protein
VATDPWVLGPMNLQSLCALIPRTDRCIVRLYQRGLMDRASGASVRRACVCVAVGPGKCLPCLPKIPAGSGVVLRRMARLVDGCVDCLPPFGIHARLLTLNCSFCFASAT